MARIPVTEAGYYNGQFVQAGGSYDDGVDPDDKASAKPDRPKKAKVRTESSDEAKS